MDEVREEASSEVAQGASKFGTLGGYTGDVTGGCTGVVRAMRINLGEVAGFGFGDGSDWSNMVLK